MCWLATPTTTRSRLTPPPRAPRRPSQAAAPLKAVALRREAPAPPRVPRPLRPSRRALPTRQ
ncbi:hypothetical protein DWQ67_12195 [Galactobacter caseinivorans]|uniref:Uncharacterized protein n=1 Tax=Galactobacter caseinivorans TaxID=2676123 RepID=A0A496PGP8_9MICC|nr:hypothetical protein DWQ67_12195 [Galactobacter caseinivorans]